MGYIDIMGQMVIPTQIPIAGDFHEGLAYVEAVGPYSSGGFINKKGEPAIDPLPGRIPQLAQFSEGLTVISKAVPWPRFAIFGQQREKVKSGYMNTGGKIVIRPQFDAARNFSEGLAEVGKNSARGEQQGQEIVEMKWGYIDKTSKMVIPAQFKETKAFSEGLAAVTEDGQKWGYIDRKGQIAIPMQFESAKAFKGELANE
ncbi:MAG: WG repeat-containing protein [Cyanobacteriota bacterium]|nr:WG repeat-containing protein [Cyanobacteriota bacterium]